MQKIGAICLRITALAAVVFSPLPAAAFGLHLGPFHLGLPLLGHPYHRHHLYMRANPREARIRSNDIARSETESSKGTTSALLYPSIALPSIIENIFFPTYSSPWLFDYQAIFTTAFARAPRQDPSLCQASFDSTWRATLSIQVALANFEAELNDAQKIRFDAMNFATRESAQPVQRDAGSGRLNAR